LVTGFGVKLREIMVRQPTSCSYANAHLKIIGKIKFDESNLWLISAFSVSRLLANFWGAINE
jgi:hypothetical protein